MTEVQGKGMCRVGCMASAIGKKVSVIVSGTFGPAKPVNTNGVVDAHHGSMPMVVGVPGTTLEFNTMA